MRPKNFVIGSYDCTDSLESFRFEAVKSATEWIPVLEVAVFSGSEL